MRTRRSPRNQERLYRLLFTADPTPQPVEHVPRCWDCRYYPPAGRSRGTCTLRGERVYGRTEHEECFCPRPRRTP